MRGALMKKWIVLLSCQIVLSHSAFAQGTWVNLSKGLDELSVEALAIDPKDPKVIFAGSERRVYKTTDSGASWKRVLGLRGSDNRVRSLYVDALDSKNVYVCTERGVYQSRSGGKTWILFFRSAGDEEKTVFCVQPDIQNPMNIYIGTSRGMFVVRSQDGGVQKVVGLPEAPVYSILQIPEKQSLVFITTARGIYKNVGDKDHWERVFVASEESVENNGGTTLEQFNVEEFSTPAVFSNLIFLGNHAKFYAATNKGIFQGSSDASSWEPLKGQTLPDQKINFIEKSSKTFYAATDRGIFQWDPDSFSFQEIYQGLDSKEIKTLSYSPSGDYLLAGTKKGIFKLSYPELTLAVPEDKTQPLPNTDQLLARFKYEPLIKEIQKVAIQYAEVHPSKIEEWRKAAARRAWLPNLSFNTGIDTKQKVDLDRGGTNDPDKFIIGPPEKSFDWSVGVSWNLGELIWNDDQTSIDTRSRLMVQLRDDILNEVTHLYYERRRLQVEMAMAPMRDLPIQIEKEIRLEELTANIDGLTGGYLSRRLQEIQEAR